MEPYGGIQAQISDQGEHRPFKTTLCFLLVNKLFIILIKSPHILF